MSSTLHYPFRPSKGRASSHESLHKAIPARPVMNHAFHALTREEMGWQSPSRETLKDVKSIKPKQLKTKASFQLNATQKRESGWDTSFPAEYGLTNLAKDFQNTLSYTQNKIKQAKETKQVLEAAHHHVKPSDVSHNINHLKTAFNCQQPQHVASTDPKDEINVMKCILIREGLVSRLKGTVQRIQIGDYASLKIQNGNSILSILLLTRDASVAVIQALHQWQSALPSPQPFIWSGKSYAHRMLDDLNFLAEVPKLAEALGVAQESMVRNPFMMPVAIPKRDIEEFRTMTTPPLVNTTTQEITSEIVNQADAYLIWSCVHLKEFPEEDIIAAVPETTSDNSATGMTNQEILQWQKRAEMQLKLLSMPMESSLGVFVMDSSPLMKRKGYLPSLSTSPPQTLKELIQTVHDDPPPKKAPVLHVTIPYTNPKYAKVKSRVSAEPFPHQKKPPKAPSKQTKRAKAGIKKRNAVVLTIEGLSISNYELEALGKDEAPPQVVALIAATVLILLAPGDLVPKDVSWNTARTLLADGKKLLRTLHNFLAGPPVAEFKMKALRPFLTNEKFRPEYLVPISTPAAVLCAWVLETVRLQSTPGAKTTSILHDPTAESIADTNDLLMYLETDDTNPQSREMSSRTKGLHTADVLVIRDPPPDERDEMGMDPSPDVVVFSGKWHYHGLTYFVSFYLAQIEPSCVLQLKINENKSAIETQASITEDEMLKLFGPNVVAFVYERAWVPLCEEILARLDNVVNPTVPLPQLDPTPRRQNPIKPSTKANTLPSADEIDAIVKIQCATRQKLSREKADRLRRHREEKLKNPTLFMSATELKQYEDHVLEMQHKEHVNRNEAMKQAQEAAVLRIQCATRQKLSREKAAKKRNELKKANVAQSNSPTHSPTRRHQRTNNHPHGGDKRRRSLMQQQDEYLVDIETDFHKIELKAKKSIAYYDKENSLHRDALELARADHAALKIQCLARQRAACVNAKRRESQELIKSLSLPAIDEKATAAVKIQSIARQKAAKKRVNSMRLERTHIPAQNSNREGAAVRIQCLARQRAAKKRVHSMRKCLSTTSEEKEAAALKIQCLARQRAAKKRVNARRSELHRNSMPTTEKEYAALRIQCLARQRAAKKRVSAKRLELKRSLALTDKEQAALRIQCLARQRAARKKVDIKRKEKLAFTSTHKDADDAALKIQCFARQRAARKKVATKRKEKLAQQNPNKNSDDAALTIQCLARQRAARKKVAALRLQREDFEDYGDEDFDSPPPSRAQINSTPLSLDIISKDMELPLVDDELSTIENGAQFEPVLKNGEPQAIVPLIPLPAAEVGDIDNYELEVLPALVPSPSKRTARDGELFINCEDAPSTVDMSVDMVHAPATARDIDGSPEFTPRVADFHEEESSCQNDIISVNLENALANPLESLINASLNDVAEVVDREPLEILQSNDSTEQAPSASEVTTQSMEMNEKTNTYPEPNLNDKPYQPEESEAIHDTIAVNSQEHGEDTEMTPVQETPPNNADNHVQSSEISSSSNLFESTTLIPPTKQPLVKQDSNVSVLSSQYGVSPIPSTRVDDQYDNEFDDQALPPAQELARPESSYSFDDFED